ncbi:hypothetical protein ACHAXR_011083 [Thalassiosira sp. AJA248-18]
MSSTRLPSNDNDGNFFVPLPSPTENSNADDERSLSFSSSSAGGNDNLHIRLDDHIATTTKQLSELYVAQQSSVSNISTSAATIRVTNASRDCSSPPNIILGDGEIEGNNKRSIFGYTAQKKYNVRRSIEGGQTSQTSPMRNEQQLAQYRQVQKSSPLSDLIMEKSIATPDEKYNVRKSSLSNQSLKGQHLTYNSQVERSPLSDLMMKKSIPAPDENDDPALDIDYSPIQPTSKTLLTPPRTPRTPNNENDSSNPPPLHTVGYQTNFLSPNMSPLTPLGKTRTQNERYHKYMMKISDADESSMESTTKEYAVKFDPTITRYNGNEPFIPVANDMESPQKSQDSHYHAQALLLSLAFFFIWSPQNLLAPNLTQAAYDFGYGDDTHARDLYLGSNLALASSVLSLPFSALIGFASDVVSSRRILISVTTFVGGMAAIATGMATTYPQLILSRFIGGSCMSGSVPVVFSLLSDWFDDKDRNAASSGFTAMMGAGIILGQVFAGCTGPSAGWRHSFYISGILTMLLAVLVLLCVHEPVRGGKERVLREMLANGKKYDKTLTWSQFVSSMTNHSSNCLLMLQGFFCNIPWGVMFVFLNDFLSQEKGLTVVDATFIVAVFGFGCAVGGILGGYLGSLASRADRRYLPLFMALTTLLGIAPFLALLDDPSYDHAGLIPCFYAFAGGCLASMPSVNVRPCIINVNPPEIRGAALTAANLIINAARGAGPSFLTTMLMGVFGVNRASGFNIMIILFWTITSIQLALLAKTLPLDQERMETELANYANASLDVGYGSIPVDDDTHDGIESYYDDITLDGKSIFSIENQASSFDAIAARQSLQFMGDSLRDIGDGLSFCSPTCGEQRRVKQPVYTEYFQSN